MNLYLNTRKPDQWKIVDDEGKIYTYDEAYTMIMAGEVYDVNLALKRLITQFNGDIEGLKGYYKSCQK